LLDGSNSVEVSGSATVLDLTPVSADNSFVDGDNRLADSESEMSLTRLSMKDGLDTDETTAQSILVLPETSADWSSEMGKLTTTETESCESTRLMNDHRNDEDCEAKSEDRLLDNKSTQRDSVGLERSSDKSSYRPSHVSPVNDVNNTDGNGPQHIDLTEVCALYRPLQQ